MKRSAKKASPPYTYLFSTTDRRSLTRTMYGPDADTIRASALLITPLVLGLLQHIMTEPAARSWQSTLNKSPYRPPPWVFPIVWTWSYLTIGYSSHLVERNLNQNQGLLYVLSTVYAAHLVLVTCWGFMFYSLRRIDYALNVMLLIDISATMLIVSVWNIVPFAATLCLPYLLWLFHLTYLNIYMFRNNVSTYWATVSKEQVLLQHQTPLTPKIHAS